LLKNQQQSPVVTFTKKQPNSHLHEKQKKDNEIESINQTIDNLPVNKKESTQKNYGHDTIDHIIKQNTKQQ